MVYALLKLFREKVFSDFTHVNYRSELLPSYIKFKRQKCGNTLNRENEKGRMREQKLMKYKRTRLVTFSFKKILSLSFPILQYHILTFVSKFERLRLMINVFGSLIFYEL